MKDKNPFEGHSYPLPKKPIEIAMDEIKVLKKTIVDLRNELEPLKQDLQERQKKLAEEEAEYEKIVKNSWW
jgi:predicted  nucleic acid-binding Zn-ribbon protein